MQSTSQKSCRSSAPCASYVELFDHRLPFAGQNAGFPPIAVTMRIKRRLTTLLFKGRRSFHIKVPHSFDVRIGVVSWPWRAFQWVAGIMDGTWPRPAAGGFATKQPVRHCGCMLPSNISTCRFSRFFNAVWNR